MVSMWKAKSQKHWLTLPLFLLQFMHHIPQRFIVFHLYLLTTQPWISTRLLAFLAMY